MIKDRSDIDNAASQQQASMTPVIHILLRLHALGATVARCAQAESTDGIRDVGIAQYNFSLVAEPDSIAIMCEDRVPHSRTTPVHNSQGLMTISVSYTHLTLPTIYSV